MNARSYVHYILRIETNVVVKDLDEPDRTHRVHGLLC